MRSVPAGIALQAPTRQDQTAAFNAVCGEHSDIKMLAAVATSVVALAPIRRPYSSRALYCTFPAGSTSGGIIGPSPDGSAIPSSSHVKRPASTSWAAA